MYNSASNYNTGPIAKTTLELNKFRLAIHRPDYAVSASGRCIADVTSPTRFSRVGRWAADH